MSLSNAAKLITAKISSQFFNVITYEINEKKEELT